MDLAVLYELLTLDGQVLREGAFQVRVTAYWGVIVYP